MKKSTIINISGIAFYLEEEAYQKLDSYLTRLKMHFKDVEDQKEIIEDIENRVAEKFSDAIKTPQSVITLEVVENIIKSMGMPEEFGDEENKSENVDIDKNVFANRKLFRDPDNKVIGGVISGFVAYFGIPEKYLIFIRIGIVIMLFFDFLNVSWFISLALYIFAYLSIPEATSVTDRVEMRGKPITLANIQSTIAADLEGSEKKISKRKKLLLLPFRIIGKCLAFIKWFIKYCLSKIIGLSVIFFSMALFITITWAAIMVTFFKDSPLIETPLKTFPDKGLEYAAVFFSYLFFLLPVLFAIILGVSILKRRYVLKNVVTYSFLGIWIISFFLGGSLLFKSAPEIRQNYEDAGMNNVNTYAVDEFDKVELAGDYERNLNAKIFPSNENKIVIKGNQRDVEYKVEDKKLIISILHSSKICLFCNEYTEVEIYTSKLNNIDVKEYVYVSVEDFKNLEELNITSTDYYSSIYLKGEAKKLNAELKGYISLQAFDFKVDNLNISMAGGTAEVFVKNNIDAKLLHNSILIYRGEPQIKKDMSDSSEDEDNSKIIPESERKILRY